MGASVQRSVQAAELDQRGGYAGVQIPDEVGEVGPRGRAVGVAIGGDRALVGGSRDLALGLSVVGEQSVETYPLAVEVQFAPTRVRVFGRDLHQHCQIGLSMRRADASENRPHPAPLLCDLHRHRPRWGLHTASERAHGPTMAPG